MNQRIDHTSNDRGTLHPGGKPRCAPHPQRAAAPASPWDIAAFWELWAEHRDHVYQVCLRHTDGNHAEAEEALAEAMLKARKSLVGSFEVPRMPAAWLNRLALNRCLDLRGAKARRLRLEGQAAELARWSKFHCLGPSCSEPPRIRWRDCWASGRRGCDVCCSSDRPGSV